MLRRRMTVVVLFSALIVIISMGTRQSLGLFLKPITLDLGIGRETFSLAVALQNILFGVPLMGILADRFGSRWILVLGGLLYAGGLLLLSIIQSPPGLFLSLGVLLGLALSSASYVVVLGAVAQVAPPARRSTAFGIITAAGSFGMFAVVPLAQWLLSRFGWQGAFLSLAAFVGTIILLSFGLPDTPPTHRHPSENRMAEATSFADVLVKARSHSGYWLLTAGFFVCGFHVAFIATHLPAFLEDQGLSTGVSATALSLIGVFNIFGSYSFGMLGDRFRKKYLLSFLYFSRAIVISLFLLLPLTNMTALAFGGAIGFLWLATVPLTSGTIAQIFGSRYLSSLYGIVFFSHQIGAFLGVWLGGRIFDASGSYTPVWIGAIALGIVASIVHLPITDRPLEREPLPEPVVLS
jgi:MFS family permease